MTSGQATRKTDIAADYKYGGTKLVNRHRRLGSSKTSPEAVKRAVGNTSGIKSGDSDSLQSESCISLPSVGKIITTKPGGRRAQSVLETSSTATTMNGIRSRFGTSKGGTAESLVSSFSKMRINRYQATRNKIETVQDISRLIVGGHIQKIVVMVGAGISTPSGIPDFRTPGTGLYDNLQKYKIPYAEAIFDIDYFRDSPKPFFTLAKELYPTGKYQPSAVHYFLLMLHQKGLLHRVYTQNIDGLERLSGVPVEKLVEAHGSFYSASCIDCHRSQPTEDVKVKIFDGKVPICKDLQCQGLVKPDIVFFGEDLPSRFFKYSQDFSQADLLLVMGTSLKVEPFASIVNSVRFPVPRVLFNYSLVGPFRRAKSRINDVAVTGDLVERIHEFVALLGWTEEFTDILASKSVFQQNRLPPSPDTKRTPSDDVASAADEAVTNAVAADTLLCVSAGLREHSKTMHGKLSTASNRNTKSSMKSKGLMSRSKRSLLPSLSAHGAHGRPRRSSSTSSMTSSSSSASSS